MAQLRRMAFVLFVLPFLSISLIAQDVTGRVAGVVKDPSGGAVVDASITVTNIATQISKSVKTDKDGFYEVRQLPIGTYQVTAEATGFSKTTSQPSALDINQTLRFDLTLAVGDVTQTVTVESQGSTVETQNSTVGGTVTGQAIFELPLNGRNTLDLLHTQPGVTASNPDNGGAGGYSIAGGRTDSVTYLLDGALNNDLLSNAVVVNPNPDAVAEFRVLESTYSAEYGRNAGGVVSVVSKSGTNQLHGTAYDYVRNDFFNANDFFLNEQGQPRAILKRNQYGGTIGGPIVIPKVVNGKNKLFFFFSYQGQKQTALDQAGKVQTFTPAQATGDFSQAVGGGPDPAVVSYLQAHPYYQSDPALAAQGIIDPTKIDPVALSYFKNHLIPTSASGFLFPTAAAKANANEYLGKLDYTISDKDNFSGTFTAHDGITTAPFSLANVTGYTSATYDQTYSAILSYTHIFTPTLLNEVRASVARTTPSDRVPVGSTTTPATLGINVTPDQPTGPPILFFDSTGLTTGYSGGGPTSYANTVYSYYDNLTWTKGNHNLKFGFYFSPYDNNTSYDFYVNGSYDFYGPSTAVGSGSDFANFLMGLPDDYFQAARALSNIRSHQYAGYGQDDWHVTRRFTLNVGLRYEYSEPKFDTQGRSFSFIGGHQSTRFPNAPNGIIFPGDAGAPKGVNFPDKNDFAPRAGFAWDVFGNAKTAVRGGFGVFYDVLKGEDNLQFNGSPPFYAEPTLYFNPVGSGQTASPNYLSNPFGTNQYNVPNGFPSKATPSNVDFTPYLPFGSALYLVDPHLRTPYVFQYNLKIQQELANGLSAELGYVGNSSHKLTSLVDINPFTLGTNNRILNLDPNNPTYTYLYEFQNVSDGDYNSMQASLNKRFGDSKIGNTFFTFSYTWSHSIDNASGFRQRNSVVPYYNHSAFRASSDLDVRQSLTLSGGWDLPFNRMWQGGPKLLTKGWSIYPIVSWRTGFPLDVMAGLSTRLSNPGPAGDGQAGSVRADLVLPTVSTYNPRATQTLNGNTGNFFFNPAAFSNTNLVALNSLSQTNAAALIGQFTEGSFPRNGLRGPGYIGTDVTLSKHLDFFEKWDTELRLDAFNVLNHANFANPNTSINSPNFGQVSQTIGSDGSVNDGPRILQIALHLRF